MKFTLGDVQIYLRLGIWVTAASACFAGMIRAENYPNSAIIGWKYDFQGRVVDTQTSQPVGLTNVIAVAAGDSQDLALTADGSVVSLSTNSNLPSGLTNVTAIAAHDYSYALKADGTMVRWLGSSVQATNWTDIVAIEAGSGFSAALHRDREVSIWNYSWPGTVPPTHADVVAVAVGKNDFPSWPLLFLKTDGTVNCWGRSWLPAPLAVTNVIAIAGSYGQGLALRRDGTVVAWRYSSTNQVESVPADVTNVVAIAAAAEFFLALRGDGSVVCWGQQTNLPPGLTNISAIAAGTDRALALRRSWPCFVQQPHSQIVTWGRPVVFHTTALGHGPIRYQWQRNGSDMPGATNASLWIDRVQPGDAGNYQCRATDVEGTTVASDVAQLHIVEVYPWASSRPAQARLFPELTNLVAIACGTNHNLALRGDGTVLAWENDRIEPSTVPADLTNVVAIAAGDTHSVALKGDGTVIAWGANDIGQTNVPPGLSNVVAVSAGGRSNLALRSDGSVVAWGWLREVPAEARFITRMSTCDGVGLASRQDGRVIRWTHVGALEPPIYAGFSNVVALDIDYYYISLALRDDGTMVVWRSSQPSYQFSSVSNVVAICIANQVAFGLQADGAVVSWSLSDTLLLPHEVPPLDLRYGVALTAAKLPDYYGNRGLVLVNDGGPKLLAQSGSLTKPFGESARLHAKAVGRPPLRYQWAFEDREIAGATNDVLILDNLQKTNVGSYSAIIRNPFGTVRSSNILVSVVPVYGPLVLGNLLLQPSFTNVTAIATARKIGDPHYLLLRADGTVFKAGGVGTEPEVPAGLNGVSAIAAYVEHYLALRSNGTVVAWGKNDFGQADVPPGLTNVVAIAVGSRHSLALNANGIVVAWGDNTYGQTNVPANLTNVVAVSAGNHHNLALTVEGKVTAWGWNYLGQTNVPPDLTGVVAIATGEVHNLVLKRDGTLVAWGGFREALTNVPPDLTNIIAIAADSASNVAQRSDGRVIILDFSGGVKTIARTDIVKIANGWDGLMLLRDEILYPPFQIEHAESTAGLFRCSLPACVGKTCQLEYSTTLDGPSWTPLPLISGRPDRTILTDPGAAANQRFYRVRQWAGD